MDTPLDPDRDCFYADDPIPAAAGEQIRNLTGVRRLRLAKLARLAMFAASALIGGAAGIYSELLEQAEQE